MGYIKDIIKQYQGLKFIAFAERFAFPPFSVLKGYFVGKNHLVHENEKFRVRERLTVVPIGNQSHNELSLKNNVKNLTKRETWF